MNSTVSAVIEALRAKDPERAEQTIRLHPRMLELWAAAEERDPQADLRWAWLSEPEWNRDPAVLAQRAAATWPERVAVALNPYAPEPLLIALSGDEVPFIARLAQARLEPRPAPLPRPVTVLWLWSPEEENQPEVVDAQECLVQWVSDLRWYRAEVAAGRVSREDALRYVSALPPEFKDRMLDVLHNNLAEENIGSDDLAEENIGSDESVLLDYAEYLSDSLGYDYEGDWGASELVGEGLNLAWLALEEPVHPAFSDAELAEWLALVSQVPSEERGFDLFFDYPDGYEGLYSPNLYLGFAVWHAFTNRMPSFDVTMTLGPETHPALWAGARMVAWLAELTGVYRHA